MCEQPCDDAECGVLGLQPCAHGEPPSAECVRQPDGVCSWDIERCDEVFCPDPAEICQAGCDGLDIDVPPGCPIPRCLPCDEEACRDDVCGDFPEVELCADRTPPEVACRRAPGGAVNGWLVPAMTSCVPNLTSTVQHCVRVVRALRFRQAVRPLFNALIVRQPHAA